MGLPIVAIVGRPNVGKSTLVNRLTGIMDAIVHDSPGVTRDRTYRPALWSGRDFSIVDTGGLVFEDQTEFLPHIRQQVMIALEEAAVVILVVDGQTGPSPADQEIADWLRQQQTPVLLAVNKCESPQQGVTQAAQFWELSLGEPFPVSGIHGNGTGDLLDQAVAYFPDSMSTPDVPEIKVAIVGRPNVGKSSLLNAFVGETRSIVSPISGTTRDTIDMVVQRGEQTYRFIDTAGIRRKKNVSYGPEFFGINRAFKAIRRSQVVLFVIDALDGVTEQDQKLAGRIIDEGRACILVINKWDAITKDTYTINEFSKQIRARLNFMDWAELIFVSALTGQRVEKILGFVDTAAQQFQQRVTTSVINEVLEEAVSWHTPPTNRQGRQGKIYYGTQVSSQPPTIALFVNNPEHFKDNYRRYIERQFRENLDFTGTPIRLLWRGKKLREVERNPANRATRA
ncbi:MAG: ribosome biogenesis GTPase Der [Acaryochloris sp. RU_4_1]|nr:ribosome biogenesis GTPase Der [Acaryochloris sp. RU_4_1]NJR54464.1 ribosome biogenesis GTPase Der [Acaryochloris sp. CRU_2_0]